MRIVVGLVLALILLVGLVLSAPARLLSSVVPEQSVVLRGLEGTVWRGSAGRVLVNTGVGYLELGAVEWHLSPLSLFSLSPRVGVESRWGVQRISAQAVMRLDGRVDLSNLEAVIPAELVRQFAPVLLGGEFLLKCDDCRLHRGLPVAATGQVEWRNASWQSATGQMPLGHYVMNVLGSEEAGLRGSVTTLEGPVQAEGSVGLDGRAYQIDLLIGGDQPLDSQLVEALRFVARPQPDGYRLQMQGEIPD